MATRLYRVRSASGSSPPRGCDALLASGIGLALRALNCMVVGNLIPIVSRNHHYPPLKVLSSIVVLLFNA